MTPEKMGVKTEPVKPPMWSDSAKQKFDFILDRIKKQEDGMGRSLSHIFRVLPTKNDLPEYYKIIKRPIDLEKVSEGFLILTEIHFCIGYTVYTP